MWKKNKLKRGLLAYPVWVLLLFVLVEGRGMNSGADEPNLENPKLSEVLKEDFNGLDRRGESEKALLLNLAKIYAQQAKKTRILTQFGFNHSSCNLGSTYTPFCEVTFDPTEPQRETRSTTGIRGRRAHRRAGGLIREAKKWIEKGDLAKLNQLPRGVIVAALRSVSKFSELKAVEEKVLASGKCENPVLELNIATKIEEFFPDPDAVGKALAHYERAISCQREELVEKASYRIGMIHIFKQQCDAARPHLERLAYERKSPDYGSRALYWLANCEKEAKNDGAYLKARQSLLGNYPFSLHSLLLKSEDHPPMKSVISKLDSPVRFRSEFRTEVNSQVTVIESLIKIHEDGLARKLLLGLIKNLEDTEPEFQLYVAALFNRVRDNLSKFKIMNALFHSHAEMLSRAAMELYYPHQFLRFGELSQAKVDRFLLLSLIRQESAFDERARSASGAMGLMQLMPRTARRIEKVRARDLYDPNANIRIGTKYFSSLLRKYEGDIELALAAYNAGSARVEEWEKRYPAQNRLLFIDLIPYKETREYVSAIARNYFWYNFLYLAAQARPGMAFKVFGT